jgi:hypothetical protein
VDLLMVMVAGGDKWLAGQAGPPVLYRYHACGEISQIDLRCAHCRSQCMPATSMNFPALAPLFLSAVANTLEHGSTRGRAWLCVGLPDDVAAFGCWR